MAYLFLDKNILAFDKNDSNYLKFMDYKDINANIVTVAFHSSALSSPSSSLCSGNSYILAIYSNKSTQSTRQVLCATSDQNKFVLGDINNTNIIKFMISEANNIINLNLPFNAKFISNLYETNYHIFACTSSPYYMNAGYQNALPIRLNNCKNCGCPKNHTCSQNIGVCIQSSQTCPPNSLCTGKCYGNCPKGGTCVSSANGIYYCIVSENWFPLWAFLLLFLLIALIVLAIYYLLSSGNQQIENKQIINQQSSPPT